MGDVGASMEARLEEELLKIRREVAILNIDMEAIENEIRDVTVEIEDGPIIVDDDHFDDLVVAEEALVDHSLKLNIFIVDRALSFKTR